MDKTTRYNNKVAAYEALTLNLRTHIGWNWRGRKNIHANDNQKWPAVAILTYVNNYHKKQKRSLHNGKGSIHQKTRIIMNI